MVIIFASEKARKFLLTRGIVYTFRKNRRKKVEKDWFNDRRGRPKISNVFIEEIGCYDPRNEISIFEFLLGYSGFNSLEEWYEEIKRLNGGKLPTQGWLYSVVLR